jgi:CHAT domain-containing protein
MGLYREYLGLLVDEDRAEDAFLVLEQSRARGLLAMLAERELLFGLDLPPSLEREQRRNRTTYDRLQERLSELSPVRDADQVEALLGELRRLRRRQEEIQDEVRTLAPRLADLQYPRPVDVEQARACLDPGTSVLAFSLGDQAQHIFCVQSDQELVVTRVAVRRETLAQEINLLRHLIEAGRDGARVTPELERLGTRLYDTLLRPFEEAIASADRVLLIPEGPLHVLPFAALLRGEHGSAEPTYLARWKPTHHAVSATVYAQIIGRRPTVAGEGLLLVAFGDPLYRPLRGRSGMGAGDRLEPLPWSRREVQAVAALAGEAVRVWLGREASEERAKGLGRGVDIVHFACHGLLNERFPLDSALALSTPEEARPGTDNGLLQAWEVFESVRLDADLVTLSACASGLGKEVAGEGLIGLTRAFQYAGARSVLASLWSVGDLSTAELMERFYRHLLAGQSKDVALQQAQSELIETGRGRAGRSEPDFSHPFHWAGFRLQGDWR